MPSIAEKCRTFRDLHRSGCFVLPNPWDVGSARYLQSLGFKALASTSAGLAYANGYPDYAVPRDLVLGHLRDLVAATDVPVNADFENGFAHEPEGVAESVTLCVGTGVAGLSIEDATGNADAPLYDFPLAVERMRAARAAIDASGGEVLLVGRSEGFLVGRPDLTETIRRLTAYAEAGADCLYAPGIRSREHIEAMVKAVAPKPFNLLVGYASEMKVPDIAALGVRRISVGGGLSRAAWGGFMRAAKALADEGSFVGFAGTPTNPELNAFFSADLKTRPT